MQKVKSMDIWLSNCFQVIDLWTYDWDPEMFPDCILKFYEKAENEKSDSEENVTNKKVNTAEQQQTNDQESVVWSKRNMCNVKELKPL